MNLHERLRMMRKANDFTQEQLAEALGISPQAVSRWETGTTSPDITLLAPIAELFSVTVDELLGVNEKQKQAEIDRILTETEEEINRNRPHEPIRILREALNRWPHNDKLLCMLQYALYAASEDEDFCREHDGEIISIAARIREFSRDIQVQNESRRVLFRHYCDTNRRAEAMQLWEGMISAEASREDNLYWALDGEERVRHLEDRIRRGLRELTWAVWAYSVHAKLTEDERVCFDSLRDSIREQVETVMPFLKEE